MSNRIAPRLLNQEQTAEYLGGSRSWFSKAVKKLEASGFPKPALEKDQFGGARWDKKLIDDWMDRLSGIATTHQQVDIENVLNERIDHMFN